MGNPDYYRREGQRYLADRWREIGGRKSIINSINAFKSSDLESLRETEWSVSFEKSLRLPKEVKRLMQNRLIMGALRYGKLHAEGKPQYDRLERAKLEMSLFISDKNGEHCIDALNMILLEWEEGTLNKSNLVSFAKFILSQYKLRVGFHTVINNVKARELG